MLRVVYYARVSTEEEKQVDALKTQCEENEEFISKQEDWILVDKYIDEGKSATTTKGRNDFERLINDMQIDKFDIILIKIIDRGWRNTLDWKLFEKSLIINKKKLFIKARNAFYDFTNATDYMATGFEAQFAEWVSINQSIKMNQAHKTRMKKGTVVTNGTIWGYNQVNSRLEINEDEAKIVRLVFNSYVEGKGFRTIAKELDALGIKNSNGNPFALTTLKRMIRQEKYKGTLVCGKRHKNFFTKEYENVPKEQWIIHENIIPSIVSIEIWNKANEVLEGKKKAGNNENVYGRFQGSYPLSGKIYCGKCGKTYYHANYASMINDLWECQKYRNYGKDVEKGGCDNKRIEVPVLNDIIKEVIFEFWTNREESIEGILKVLNTVMDEDNNSNEIKEKQNNILKFKKRKDNLVEDRIERVIDVQTYTEKLEEIQGKLDKLETDIGSLMETNKIIFGKKERLENIKNYLNYNYQSKEQITDEFIEEIVEKVIVDKDNKIEVYLTGDYCFTKEIPSKNTKSHNVSNHGQDRYSCFSRTCTI